MVNQEQSWSAGKFTHLNSPWGEIGDCDDWSKFVREKGYEMWTRLGGDPEFGQMTIEIFEHTDGGLVEWPYFAEIGGSNGSRTVWLASFGDAMEFLAAFSGLVNVAELAHLNEILDRVETLVFDAERGILREAVNEARAHHRSILRREKAEREARAKAASQK